MAISWYAGHITHVIVAFIYAIATVSLTALEVYFIKNVTSSETFFIVLQNVGIMGTSGYFASQIKVTPTGLTESNKGGN
jgi:3-dehydroquinate dehydratase